MLLILHNFAFSYSSTISFILLLSPITHANLPTLLPWPWDFAKSKGIWRTKWDKVVNCLNNINISAICNLHPLPHAGFCYKVLYSSVRSRTQNRSSMMSACSTEKLYLLMFRVGNDLCVYTFEKLELVWDSDGNLKANLKHNMTRCMRRFKSQGASGNKIFIKCWRSQVHHVCKPT